MDPNIYQYGITVDEPIDERSEKQIRDIRGLKTSVTMRVLPRNDRTLINGDKVDFWVEKAMTHTNQYIVRLYGRTNLRDEQQAVFTEVCPKTFKEWMQNQRDNRNLSDPGNHTTAYLPHPDIGAMLLNIFRGLISIRVHHQGCQAHVSEDDIFVIDNNPKFSKLIVRGDSLCEGEDILNFCEMMKPHFKNSAREMANLRNYLEKYRLNEEVLAKAINYPAWLPLGERLDYRDDANAIVLTLENNDKTKWHKLSVDLKKNLGDKNSLVDWTRTLSHNQSTDRCKDMYRVYEFQKNNARPYSDNPLSFLRFGRNYKHHKEYNCTKELAEKRLTWLYPNFMSSLHEAFILNRIYVRP